MLKTSCIMQIPHDLCPLIQSTERLSHDLCPLVQSTERLSNGTSSGESADTSEMFYDLAFFVMY